MPENTAPIPEIKPSLELSERHSSAIKKLSQSTKETAQRFIDEREGNPRLLIKDSVVMSGGILIGMGIFQFLGVDLPNVLEGIPLYQDMFQMILDTKPGIKIGAGLGAFLKKDSSSTPPMDMQLAKAYMKDWMTTVQAKRNKDG